MATLTETAYYSRKGIKYGLIGIAAILVLRSALLFSIAYYKRLNPPPPPAPTVAFGKLPVIVFPNKERPALTYKLETVNGDVEYLGDRAKVYFMPVRLANLLALERMTNQAKKLDFQSTATQLSSRKYQFNRDSPIPATMTVDIVTGSFTVKVEWQLDPGLLKSTSSLPSKEEAISEARSFLQRANLLPEDLLAGEVKVTYLKADVLDLVEAVSQSEADFVRVDLFRAAVDELTVYPTNPNIGVVSLIMSGERSLGKQVIKLNYNYFPVDFEESATYPIKTGSEAWNQLQAGEGYVAAVNENVKQAVVRRVSLGYYDSVLPQHYLQPIYVFSGDENYLGYVPAIDDAWVE